MFTIYPGLGHSAGFRNGRAASRRAAPQHKKSPTIASSITLDDQMTISELSADVLRHLASRIEASHSIEQILYRETELDEVWRLADLELAALRLRKDPERHSEARGMAAIAELVHAAHDFIGQNDDTTAAAAALREAAILTASLHAQTGA